MLVAILLAGAAGQDLSVEAFALEEAGRYGEALEILDSMPQDPATALQRALCLWSGGDLGGALLSAEAGLALSGDSGVRRKLLWRAMELSLELGEVGFAEERLSELEASVSTDPDLPAEELEVWKGGWGAGTGILAARQRVAIAVEHLDAAGEAESRARFVCALAALLALGVLGLVSRP